jgi:hypothetical protein
MVISASLASTRSAILDLLLKESHYRCVIEFDPFVYFCLLDRCQSHAHGTLAHFIPAFHGVFHRFI